MKALFVAGAPRPLSAPQKAPAHRLSRRLLAVLSRFFALPARPVLSARLAFIALFVLLALPVGTIQVAYAAAPAAAPAATPVFESPFLPEDDAAKDIEVKKTPSNEVRAAINFGGPEQWAGREGLSTTLPASAASGQAPLASGVHAAQAPSQAADQTLAPVTLAPVTPAPVTLAPVTPPAAAQVQAPASAVGPLQGTAPIVAGSGSSLSAPINLGAVGLPGGVAAEKKDDAKAEEAAKAPPPREVVYVDEQGNPVPKPPEPDKMMAEAERLIGERKYDEALPQLENIRAIPDISAEMLEKALYYISDCLAVRYASNPLAGYEAVVSSTNEAMNANLRSSRVPDALLRLGLINLKVGNLGEAGGYIVALLRRYPHFPGVAQGFTALGHEQVKRGLNNEAEQSFGLVLDKYPDSSYLQDASVGLARAFYNQKKFEKAKVILDFISKRWPRYYIEDPSFLLMQAGNDIGLGHTDLALENYWLYVNLDPSRKGNDGLMLTMGDMYQRKNDTYAANFLYTMLRQRFSASLAAETAALRLAEKGIYDSPVTYEQMSRVFAIPRQEPLGKVYADLAASSNTAPNAVTARLKSAMLLYWDKAYTEAMGKAAEFIDAYPESPDAPEARDIIWHAFQKELANALTEQNFGRILVLWNGFPLVRERYGPLDATLRYALAKGYLERGEDTKALEMLAEFLQSPMDPQYGELAFLEFFNRYLQAGAWDKILDLGKLVSTWSMTPTLRNQLDYALAISAQNLNLGGPALALWQQLAARNDIPLYHQAYAMLYLARDAQNRKDIRSSYDLYKKVIDLFTRLQDERSDKADPLLIKEGIAALMDICEVGNRIPEALQWVERYNVFAPDGSPEYPGQRFREARLHRKLGDSTRAQALLEDIVQRAPDSPFAKAAASELRTFEVSRDLQQFMPGGGAQPAQSAAPPAS